MPHNVLIVDDDMDIREILGDIIRFNGHNVVTAANGMEAFDYLKGAVEKPCVVLADLLMPVMDGWQLRAKQKADPDLGPIPMVAVSAVADPNDSAIFTACLQKPVDLEVLLRLLDHHCQDHSTA